MDDRFLPSPKASQRGERRKEDLLLCDAPLRGGDAEAREPEILQRTGGPADVLGALWLAAHDDDLVQQLFCCGRDVALCGRCGPVPLSVRLRW